MTLETILHISTDGVDAHTWAVLAVALGPPLVLMFVIALRHRQDFGEEVVGEDTLPPDL